MNKGHGSISRKMWVVVGLALLVALAGLTTGCGKKAPVETDVVEPAPPPPVVEKPKPPEPKPAPPPVVDYASMNPSEYGIQDVFFAFDVYELSPDAMVTLTANAKIMRDHPDLVWLIEGHCDERGTVEYNLALGEKRAKAARDYLTSLGVPSRQFRVTSYGEEKPFAMGHDERAWAQNRRGHFARP